MFQVGVRIVSPYAKPGENKIFFSGQNLTTATKSQKYVPADTFRTIVVDEGMVSVPLTITTENKYSTCLLPFDATVPEGLRAYECVRIAGDSIIISKVENFSAYVPYILYAPNGYSGVLSGMTSATAYENRVNAEGVSVAGCLTGAVADQTISNGCVLRQTDSGMAFCPANGALYQVPAGKCWLNAGTSLSGSFVFAEESLAGISNHDVQGKSHAVYSLDGIRLPEMRKGINILNGKKIAY